MQLEEDFGTEIVICKCKVCGNCIFNSERGEEFCLSCKKIQFKNNNSYMSKILTSGSTVNNIVTFAKSRKYDLVVIGSRGMGAIKEFFLGSTSNYVMHKSKKPVLIVK